ncbi:MAG: DUF5069 domain-containing protein [Verrucomicrobiota bacterium]
MNHYNYQKRLKEIWRQAVSLYEAGNRDPETYFDSEVLGDLNSIGLNVMDVYDYAEDYISSKDPDFETFLMICEARRDYFFAEQEGIPSQKILDTSKIPAKTDDIRGIVWLPRIIPKALAKLKGELPSDTMYCCGGDRRFFKTNQIHPAEFLRAAWAWQDTPEKLVDWVEARAQKTN